MADQLWPLCAATSPPQYTADEALGAAHAAAEAGFGLLNSTPRAGHHVPDGELAQLLASMALAALGVPAE